VTGGEIEAGRAAAPPEPVSEDAARAMLAAFKPDARVSAWPDAGWPGEGEELDPTEDWIVGIAYYRAFDDSSAYEVNPGLHTPVSWTPLATVPGEQKARALAGLLNSLAARGA
jgi:hypothetical protein